VVSVTETEQFVAAMSQRITEAETALHNGDARPRIATWSRTDPLTLFGAAISGVGWGEIGPIFDALGRQFSNCTSFRNEVVGAEARGDLAYTVALEHTTGSINGAEPKPYVLRVTTIFRREDGEWKVVHRHGDALSADSGELVRRLAPAEREHALPAGERQREASPPPAGRRSTSRPEQAERLGPARTPAVAETDLADFLATALPRQVETESAWHQRDLDARLALWSTREPVTLFGGGGACVSSSDEVRRNFRTAVTGIIPCRSFDYNLVAAGGGGELAYTVGYEHISFDPGPVQDYTLRVTYLYRRENGEWKIVHRHGDYLRQ
jgi:ketosteroid isomerase-like protein